MPHRRPRVFVVALGTVLALAGTARAAGSGPWRLSEADPVSIDYFQGLTHGPGGSVFFDGPAQGFYRTTTNLKQLAGVDDIYPADLAAIGFNHAGDPTYDPSQGGRVLAPMECYHPDQAEANTCGIGGFGVLDPTTLAWKYWVRLDQADIPKAMWAEVSPDAKLVWTSSGNDLLAYSTADISAANAASGAGSPPIHPVKRLVGAVPPSGVTGAAFIGGRLFMAGDVQGLLQIRSVDLTGRTPTRIEVQLPGIKAESEGLDLLDMRGGTLHWILSPTVAGNDPTYGNGHTELLSFLPAGSARLHLTAVRRGRGAIATVTTVYGGKVHPVAGALVGAGRLFATSSATGKARFAHVASGRVRLRATKLQLSPGSATLR